MAASVNGPETTEAKVQGRYRTIEAIYPSEETPTFYIVGKKTPRNFLYICVPKGHGLPVVYQESVTSMQIR